MVLANFHRQRSSGHFVLYDFIKFDLCTFHEVIFVCLCMRGKLA